MRARLAVVLSTVAALVGLVIVAPAAFAAAPDAPAPPTLTGGIRQITVTFAAPLFDGGSQITGYTATCTSSDGGVTNSNSNTGAVSPIVVTGLSSGKTYTCTVTATNGDGTGNPSSSSSSVVTPNVPGAPAKPSVAAGNAQIVVSFGAPASDGGTPITGYTASCTDGSATFSNGSTGSPIVVAGLTNGSTYTCTVTAANGVGSGPASPASNAVSPAAPATVPSAPATPTLTAGDTFVTIAFAAPFNGGSPITSYTATCTRPSSTVEIVAIGPASPITIDQLHNGTPYTCGVAATNGVGPGPSSPTATAVPVTGPDAPPQPAVVSGNAQIGVFFSAPGSTGGSPIIGYSVVCTSSNGGLRGTATGSGSPILVTSLTNGRSYTCAVAATNANSTGKSSPPSAAVIPSTVPGQAPTPTVSGGNGQVFASFRAPANGGSAITAYLVICSSTNGGRAGSNSGSESPVTVAGLTNSKIYRCAVSARNVRGSGPRSPLSGPVTPSPALTAQSTPHGFRLFAGDGGVFAFGSDRNFGSAAGVTLRSVVGMATTPDTNGYWLVATDGGIFSYGDARFWGSTGAIRLNQPVVGMTPTPSGNGYWLVASDGGIFSYGDARFWGSTGAIRLNQPIVGMASTPTGNGYWLVASDGGIFAFGDARFYGSPAAFRLPTPVVGMATTAHGHGYWLASADGSVYHFGDASALGSVTVQATRLPVRGIASTVTGRGYWLAAGDGGVFSFGDAPYIGWPGPLVLRQQIRGVSR